MIVSHYFLIACGGAIGALCRYTLTMVIAPNASVPYNTLCINIIGSFAMGCIAMGLMQHQPAHPLRLFFAIGLLGSFTTFSTFAYETLTLIERNMWLPALGYSITSVVVSIAACATGMYVTQMMLS